MNCPKCKTELIKGKLHRDDDGTEYFELKCPKCKGRFMDLKIPYTALLGMDEDYWGAS